MPWLEWLDRKDDVGKAGQAPYRLLEPVHKLDCGEADSPNMLIEGDNLDALKALLPYYGGQVKCIFIDPPYNTRSAFEHYDDNLEHAKWLSMMYPRLELLRKLLAKDGSVWITIDDHEAHYLKVICDEVFGRKSFIASIAWENFYGRSNAAAISPAHNHILVYAPLGTEEWKKVRGLLPRSEKSAKKYKNEDNDPRGPWRLGPIFAAEERHDGLMYEVVTPSGRKVRPPPGSHWRMVETDFWDMVKDGRITFGPNGSNIPAVKLFLREVQAGMVPRTWWPHGEAGHTQDAKREIQALFPGQIPFGTPKPEQLVRLALEIASKPGDLVLDSFLGSGTTAAVAHKMERKWIGVEAGAHAQTYCQPRLQKVVAGEQGGISHLVGWQGGGGFRYYKLGPAVFDDEGRIRNGIKFEWLAAHVWFAETGVARSTRAKKSPLLGVHEGTAYYLLYNGILGDKTPNGGNVLTLKILADLPPHDGRKVIYGEATRLSQERLDELGIVFRQTPYDIKAR